MASAPIVRSLAEALEMANGYPENVGYYVAPLSTRNGGARKWHGANSSNRRKWLSENDRNEETEALPRHPDDGVEGIDPLPASKIDLWELAFVRVRGNDLEFIRPRILIDPSHNTRSVEPEHVDTVEFLPSFQTVPSGTLDGAMVTLFAQQQRFALDLMKQNKELLSSVSGEHREMQRSLKEDLKECRAHLLDAEKKIDEGRVANAIFIAENAQLKSDNLLAQEVGQLFKGKPELILEAGGKLLAGIVRILQGQHVA